MKTSSLIRLSFMPALTLFAIYFSGCSSDNPDINKDLKNFREEVNREDAMTDRVMEENLDDELNETERRAVHPIFENNQKERARMVNDVFGEQPAAK